MISGQEPAFIPDPIRHAAICDVLTLIIIHSRIMPLTACSLCVNNFGT